MKFVPNVRRAWKWFSVQAFAFAGAIQAVWMNLPLDVKAQIPAPWVMKITLIVCVAGLFGRLVDQGTVPPSET